MVFNLSNMALCVVKSNTILLQIKQSNTKKLSYFCISDKAYAQKTFFEHSCSMHLFHIKQNGMHKFFTTTFTTVLKKINGPLLTWNYCSKRIKNRAKNLPMLVGYFIWLKGSLFLDFFLNKKTQIERTAGSSYIKNL